MDPIDLVRDALLSEAKQSPALLSDLAGLEQYVSESYDSRSFVELLQNADDALATHFIIARSGDLLMVANNGKPFDAMDLEALCRSAASRKSRGETIGYRGIGFKSVVSIARKVHLLSGKFEVTFSRSRTSQDIPQAERVPLLRIPHKLSDLDRSSIQTAIDQLGREGLTTIFFFEDISNDAVQREFESFDASSLLFLRNVRLVHLRTEKPRIISLQREIVDSVRSNTTLEADDHAFKWRIWTRNGVSLAVRRTDNNEPPLPEQEAVAHAFLPTLEPTGIGAKVHGDFSTDPSRTRIVLDDRTRTVVNEAACLIVELIFQSVLAPNSNEPHEILPYLTPKIDPRLAALQRHAMKTDLYEAMKRAAENRFVKLRTRPSWLNPTDFENLCQSQNLSFLKPKLEEIDGLLALLRFLGAKDASLFEILPGAAEIDLTTGGACEIVRQLINLESTGQLKVRADLIDLRLWSVAGKLKSLRLAAADQKPLDQNFLDLIVEHLGTTNGISRLVSSLTNPAVASILLPPAKFAPRSQDRVEVISSSGQLGLYKPPTVRLKRWKRSEEHVLNILLDQGWHVEDVSRQFLGYDIQGRRPDGTLAFVEVKSIDYVGQPFTLTSNEEAAAREKADSYIVAIILPGDSEIELTLIQNPTNSLSLTRQCKQWVWECDTYPFTPSRYPVE